MTSYRRTGLIEPVSGDKIPQNLLFLDTETSHKHISDKTDEEQFRLGVLIYVHLDDSANILVRSVNRFYNLSDMQNYILHTIEQNKEIYLLGHNIGFDLRVVNIFNLLHSSGFTSEPPIINERAFIWSCRKPKHKLTVLDTANFAVQSVAKLGKDLHLPKYEVDFNTADDQTLMDYCVRDVEIIELFVLEYIRFIRENDLGGFRSTLASQALISWRHRLMAKPVMLHSNKEALDMERQAYHGGRVEVFYLGKLPSQQYTMLDINSMYPYVMKYSKLPYKLENVSHDTRVNILASWASNAYCISDITVQTDTPRFPLFYNNRLVFPIGTFRTYLNNSELISAIETHSVVSVHKTYVYRSELLFAEYVDFFYSVKVSSKMRGNASWEFIAKIFLNSLYGKFGQTNVTRTIESIEDRGGIWRLPWSLPAKNIRGQWVGWYGLLIKEIKQGETNHSFPAIAAGITANARMLLWDYIRIAGMENVFYGDTDSLIVNNTGLNNLQPYISDTELGKLKLVKQSDNVVIRGCKDYTFGAIDKTKGKRNDALILSTNSWQQAQFEGMLQWINRGGNGGPRITQIVKHRRGNYEKGTVLDSGKVVPYRFSIDENGKNARQIE